MPKIVHGYPENTEYLNLAFNLLSPSHINTCLNLAGLTACSLEKPFTYVELGAGFGLSVAGWAAQYPHGIFHSIDYNVSQAQWTQQLAALAGLDNLVVHGKSIQEALALPLPPCDFVVMHGLYSWVSTEVRQEIRQFIKSFLKPGGCLYVGYNAMPGFRDTEPMRHLVQQHINSSTNEDVRQAIQEGIAHLRALRDAGAGFFGNSPMAGKRLDNWLQDDQRYLEGELLAGDHCAYYFADIQKEMNTVGLEWVCPADIIASLARKTPPQSLAPLLEQCKSTALRESIIDLFFNTSFRYDLFRKTDKPLQKDDTSRLEAEKELQQTRFCLNHVRKPLQKTGTHLSFQANLEPRIYQLAHASLAAATPSLSQLQQTLPESQGNVLEALCVLLALDWIHPGPPCQSEKQAQRVARFNVCLHELAGTERIMPLLSATGGWVNHEDQLEHLTVLALLAQKSVVSYLLEVLGEGCSAEEKEQLEKSVRFYWKRASPAIAQFLKRHGFGYLAPGDEQFFLL